MGDNINISHMFLCLWKGERLKHFVPIRLSVCSFTLNLNDPVNSQNMELPKQLDCAQLWPAGVSGQKFPTETIKSRPLDHCSFEFSETEKHFIRNQLMMASIYSVGEPVVRYLSFLVLG